MLVLFLLDVLLFESNKNRFIFISGHMLIRQVMTTTFYQIIHMREGKFSFFATFFCFYTAESV